MLLQDYPRPAEDNGIGMHFGLDLRPALVESNAVRLKELRARWCMVAHGDEQQLERAAKALSNAGILPLSHWICHIDQNVIDFVRFIKVLTGLGLPAYIQIFNEPSERGEWRDGIPKSKVFVGRWCDHAARVADAGGFPGLQVLHGDELRAVLTELKLRGAQRVIERMWFCPHSFGANLPPAYPYDEINQREHPGASVLTEGSGVLGFMQFPPIFREALHFVPPFIVGAGGWDYGNVADPRYPPIDDARHALYYAALFDWFRTGTLAYGERLPDYVFAFCPWLLYGPEREAWYSSTSGTRQQTIDAIRDISGFTRQFTTPPPPPPGPPPKVLSHYVLFGSQSRVQRARLVLARNYLQRFNVAFGFSTYEAARATTVTVLGDYTVVSMEDEARLKRAGCRVERLLGDAGAIEIILRDRVARDAEYG